MFPPGLSNKKMNWFTQPKLKGGQWSVELTHGISQSGDSSDVTRIRLASFLALPSSALDLFLSSSDGLGQLPSSFLTMRLFGNIALFLLNITRRVQFVNLVVCILCFSFLTGSILWLSGVMFLSKLHGCKPLS